jgi:hypothetical protein
MTKLIRYVLESTITKKSSAFAELSIRFDVTTLLVRSANLPLVRVLGFERSHLSYEPLRTVSREFPFDCSTSQ